MKLSTELKVADFSAHPVWEFANMSDDHEDATETTVAPVLDLPVTSLKSRFIGTELILANKDRVFAVLMGLKLHNARLSRLALSFIVHHRDEKFLFRRTLVKPSAPEALAYFLGLPLDEIFPIRYDISKHALGDAQVVRGTILKELPEKISQAEFLRLILEDQKR